LSHRGRRADRNAAATRSGEGTTGDAIRLLEEGRGVDGRPFLLFLNDMDAHVPYLRPADYRQRFRPLRPLCSWGGYQSLATAVMSGTRQVRPNERQDFEADYDAGIAHIDRGMPHLFDRLRQPGLFDNSLSIVTADHGEMFGESGIVGHGAGLLPGDVQVPHLLKYPFQRETATVEHTVSGADILPAVLASVGLEAPSGVRVGSRQLGSVLRWVYYDSHYTSGIRTFQGDGEFPCK
jgi:arylsulfatase A-like enzyme